MSNPKKIFSILFLLIFCSTILYSQKATYEIKTKTKNLPFGLKQKTSKNKIIIGLALSGGGARGFAQIGVLKAIKEEGIDVDVITSTSMGSIIGGLYSMGYSIAEIDSIARNTNWEDLLTLNRKSNRRDLYVHQKITEDRAVFSIRLDGFKPVIPTSLNNGEKVSNFLNLLSLKAPIHVDGSFDDLKTKYRAVCTDLISGKPVVLNSGSISQAMRASASVSFLLSPVKFDSLLLVDGGLVANIPVNYAKSLGADLVIAVNTTSNLHKKDELNVPWIVADQVVSIPMKRLNDEQLKSADIVVTPNLENHLATDFNNIDTIIFKGYSSAKKLLKGIKAKIDSMTASKSLKELKRFNNLKLPNTSTEIEERFFNNLPKEKDFTSLDLMLYMDSLYKTGKYKTIKSEVISNHKQTNRA